MAKLQYGLNEEMLKNTVIANKANIRLKIKYTTISKQANKVQDDFEIEM